MGFISCARLHTLKVGEIMELVGVLTTLAQPFVAGRQKTHVIVLYNSADTRRPPDSRDRGEYPSTIHGKLRLLAR